MVDVGQIGNAVRWLAAAYLIGIGLYAVATKRLPLRRRTGSWPFPSGAEYRGRAAVIGGLVMVALGIILLFVRP